VIWPRAVLPDFLGIDGFYLRNVGTGVLKLLTIGGAGMWVLIDISPGSRGI